MTESVQSSPANTLLRSLSAVESREAKAVILGMLCFFFLFGSYSIVKPVRDAMGTVYGVDHLQELYTGTFLMSLVFAPLYSGLAAHVRLSVFLPWVYGFIALTLIGFFALFHIVAKDRWVAAAFYVWVSTFNLLIISVLWSFLADMFSREQAKRLFGFIAAGITIGGIAGPAAATALVKHVGNGPLILISAVGFVIAAVLVRLLTVEKQRMAAAGIDLQHTTLDHPLPGNPLDGFKLLAQSRYLLLLAVFLLLMTWVSTIVYFQLGDLITKSFSSREARTQAYALIDLTVNSAAVFIQLFGTGRIIRRFGVTTGLLLNPIIMVLAFLTFVISPVLMVLAGIQVIRRVAEYAVAKPAREMLFTAVDQTSKYKAKNVIDTVVYRFGDLSSAWISSAILPLGISGLAVFGLVVCAAWFPIAWWLGRRYETIHAL